MSQRAERRIRITTILVLLVGIAGFRSAEDIAAQPSSPGKCVEEPLRFLGFWGFGDWQDKALKPEASGTVLRIVKARARSWSGWSKEWKDDVWDLKGRDRLRVRVEGADSIKYDNPKMMKWTVWWEGPRKEVALICLDADKRSNDDREWVFVGDGLFEYPLIGGAGRIKKIAVTLFPGSTYDDVLIRAWLGCPASAGR